MDYSDSRRKRVVDFCTCHRNANSTLNDKPPCIFTIPFAPAPSHIPPIPTHLLTSTPPSEDYRINSPCSLAVVGGVCGPIKPSPSEATGSNRTPSPHTFPPLPLLMAARSIRKYLQTLSKSPPSTMAFRIPPAYEPGGELLYFYFSPTPQSTLSFNFKVSAPPTKKS